MASESRTRKAGRDFLGRDRNRRSLGRTDAKRAVPPPPLTRFHRWTLLEAGRPGGQPANRAAPDRVPSICLKRSSIRDVHKFSGFFDPHYYLPQYLHKPPLPFCRDIIYGSPLGESLPMSCIVEKVPKRSHFFYLPF